MYLLDLRLGQPLAESAVARFLARTFEACRPLLAHSTVAERAAGDS